jgi:hypothetical protein
MTGGKVPTDFAVFLAKHQSNVNSHLKQQAAMDSVGITSGTGGITPGNKYQNQLSQYANSDVTLNNIRSPTNNNLAKIREATNRTNAQS